MIAPAVPLRGQHRQTTAGRLLNFGAFYLGWFACVGGAAAGRAAIGPLVVAVLLAIHLYLSAHPRREAALILSVGALGFAIDSFIAWSQVYTFVRDPQTFLCPPWLTALWMNFASTLTVSLRWLSGRCLSAAVAGAVAGPLSYYAAARLGVVEFPAPTWSIAVLSAVWAVITPSLLRFAAALVPAHLTDTPGT